MIIKSDPDTIKSYLEDASGLTGAFCDNVYIPETYSEAADILKQTNSKKCSITVSGGGTGTTGGRLPFGGGILATDRLNKILAIEITDKNQPARLTVQAGVLLTDIHEAAERQGFFYPPDATELNAFIGGNVATNASGGRSFKYGTTRKYIERIKVVLSNGEIVDIPRGQYFARGRIFEKIRNPIRQLADEILNNPPKADKAQIFKIQSALGGKFKIPEYNMPDIKNASGYYSKENMDLIDLFIGSEGTLGVIVEAELKILPRTGFIFACFVFFDKLDDAINFVSELKQITYKTRLTKDEKNIDALAIEFFDQNSLKLLSSKYLNIPTKPEAVIFIEEEITPQKENSYLDNWAALLEKHNASLDNVWIADNTKKHKEFKDIRHDIPELVNEIVKRRGFPKAGTDIAVPDSGFSEMFAYYRQILSSTNIDNLIFGHIGDNHLHVNMLPKTEEEYIRVKDLYMDFVKKALSLGGTVSAEHGIGKLKHQFLKEMYGEKGIDEMIRIKKYFDQNCILGIGNIFPKERLA